MLLGVLGHGLDMGNDFVDRGDFNDDEEDNAERPER